VSEAGIDLADDETDEEEGSHLEELEKEWDNREFVSDISEDEDDYLSDLEDGLKAPEEGQSDIEDDIRLDQETIKLAHGKRKPSSDPYPGPRRMEKKTKKGPRIEVEYEEEVENVPFLQPALAHR